MQATDLIGKTALEISKLWPPNKNESSEYSDIWWASHHLCYKGERPNSVYSGETTRFRSGSYSDLTLRSYDYCTEYTVWENKNNEHNDHVELIEVSSNGAFWYSYVEKAVKPMTLAEQRAGLPTHRRPTTPGEVIKAEFLEPLKITQTQLAEAMDIPLQRLNLIINGKRAVTPDTALRLSKALGCSIKFWLNLQQSVELYDAITGPASIRQRSRRKRKQR